MSNRTGLLINFLKLQSEHKRTRQITDFELKKVYDKVEICRKWLKEFDDRFQTKNMKTIQMIQKEAV